MGHENKCAHLHGHNYEVWLHCEFDEELDNLGRVVDFSVIKKVFDTWLDARWDHGFILCQDDKAGLSAITAFNLNGGPHGFRDDGSQAAYQKMYLMPYNPTAENMAKYLLEVVAPKLWKQHGIEGVRLTKVKIFETPRCAAEVTLDD
jgi:6-pyruvoyltetrahydropterin/6-carboxytetrahydropterin synthase